MVLISEILATLSLERRKRLLNSPACKDTEDNLRNFLWDAYLLGRSIYPQWVLVSTGDDYKKPTAVAQIVYKEEPYGNHSGLITYCEQNPALEGMLAIEYTRKPTPYKWPRPKRTIFSPSRYPQDFRHELEVPTLEFFVRTLAALGCVVGPNFCNNIRVASDWLETNHPDLVDIIFQNYISKDITSMR